MHSHAESEDMRTSSGPDAKPEPCNCLALRQAARHVTQFYDQYLVPTGVRTTQFSILAKLRHLGPKTASSQSAEGASTGAARSCA